VTTFTQDRRSEIQNSQQGPTRQPLSDEDIELIAARLRVVAEPTRIRLMELLNAEDFSVQELTDRLATTQQNVSRHLGILFQAGIVSRKKEGNVARYSLVDWTGWWLVEQIGTSVAGHLEEMQKAFAKHEYK
jgi:DNA-binding transcriptional ArsR family regulator